jgi:hypothetical protein
MPGIVPLMKGCRTINVGMMTNLSVFLTESANSYTARKYMRCECTTSKKPEQLMNKGLQPMIPYFFFLLNNFHSSKSSTYDIDAPVRFRRPPTISRFERLKIIALNFRFLLSIISKLKFGNI